MSGDDSVHAPHEVMGDLGGEELEQVEDTETSRLCRNQVSTLLPEVCTCVLLFKHWNDMNEQRLQPCVVSSALLTLHEAERK